MPLPLIEKSLDTETTGVDFNHGCFPYFVTMCDINGDILYWEWDVDPMTRIPQIPENDLEEIDEELSKCNRVVMQNARFDCKALKIANDLIRPKKLWTAPWSKIRDTLLAEHLLHSNQAKDLTTLAILYLHTNLAPLEDRMEECVKEAVKIAKAEFPEWRIAKRGDPSLPSAKNKVWKNDTWLPRAVAIAKDYDKEHPWWTCTSDYANGDSASTIGIYKAQSQNLKERDLTKFYHRRLKLLPVIANMEDIGITANRTRTNSLARRLTKQADSYHEQCLYLADNEIESLPKNGASNDLKHVIFEKFGLVSNKETPTGNPSMDKSVLDYWLTTLNPVSSPYLFIEGLKEYRRRKTALGYIESYKNFWLPVKGTTMKVYPSLNPTGTDTLRMSSSNPNAQQISKQDDVNLRYCFGPTPGREWWSLDAMNIELRLPAYESEEQDLIELFENAEQPPYYGSTHLLNFHTVYPDLWDKELKEVGLERVGPSCKKKYGATWYQRCKNGGFAVQYGAVNNTKPGEMGTADRAFNKKGAHTKLKERFSRLEELNRYWIDYADKYGYVETIPDKSVDPDRGYPLMCTRSNRGKILPTVPLNYHIQGSAMWWMCSAMIRVAEYLKELNSHNSKGFYMVLQVHDELVFDFPKGSGTEPWKTNLSKIKEVKKIMEAGGNDMNIPTPVGVEYHSTSWAEGLSL